MTEKNIKVVLDIFDDMFEQSLINSKLSGNNAIYQHFRRVKIQLMKQMLKGKIILEREENYV